MGKKAKFPSFFCFWGESSVKVSFLYFNLLLKIKVTTFWNRQRNFQQTMFHLNFWSPPPFSVAPSSRSESVSGAEFPSLHQFPTSASSTVAPGSEEEDNRATTATATPTTAGDARQQQQQVEKNFVCRLQIPPRPPGPFPLFRTGLEPLIPTSLYPHMIQPSAALLHHSINAIALHRLVLDRRNLSAAALLGYPSTHASGGYSTSHPSAFRPAKRSTGSGSRSDAGDEGRVRGKNGALSKEARFGGIRMGSSTDSSPTAGHRRAEGDGQSFSSGASSDHDADSTKRHTSPKHKGQ